MDVCLLTKQEMLSGGVVALIRRGTHDSDAAGERFVGYRRASEERGRHGIRKHDWSRPERLVSGVLEAPSAEKGVVSAVQEAAARTFTVLVELLEEGQAAGALEPGDPEPMALLMLATLQGIAALANTEIIAPNRINRLVVDAIERFLHGPRTLA